MKRAIYFDDRERDLARRVLTAVAGRLEWQIGNLLEDRFTKMAARWTIKEVDALAAKFEEPTSEGEPEEATT